MANVVINALTLSLLIIAKWSINIFGIGAVDLSGLCFVRDKRLLAESFGQRMYCVIPFLCGITTLQSPYLV